MKILIVADEPGWIFERHAKEIQKRITEHDIDIAFRKQNIPDLSKNYDIVYVMDPIPLRHGYPPKEKTIMGMRCEFLYREHPNGAKGLYENGFPGRCVSIKDKCSLFHVVNRNLLKVFESVVKDKPILLVQHGVDENTFDKSKYTKKKNGVFTVGVAGRLSHQKGAKIIVEACKAAKANLFYTDYNKRLSKEEMPSFYNNLDVYICMSKTEGQNNPIMEAGAMGVPVISSDCGASREMIKDGESGLIVRRDAISLSQALEKMKDEKLRESMGEKFYKEIMENWTWEKRIGDFRKLFGEINV